MHHPFSDRDGRVPDLEHLDEPVAEFRPRSPSQPVRPACSRRGVLAAERRRLDGIFHDGCAIVDAAPPPRPLDWGMARAPSHPVPVRMRVSAAEATGATWLTETFRRGTLHHLLLARADLVVERMRLLEDVQVHHERPDLCHPCAPPVVWLGSVAGRAWREFAQRQPPQPLSEVTSEVVAQLMAVVDAFVTGWVGGMRRRERAADARASLPKLERQLRQGRHGRWQRRHQLHHRGAVAEDHVIARMRLADVALAQREEMPVGGTSLSAKRRYRRIRARVFEESLGKASVV